jgi:hypothetical protein
MKMTDKEYLDLALEYIIDIDYTDNICETLHNIPEEMDVCARECQNLDRFCILRFLKYYKKNDNISK